MAAAAAGKGELSHLRQGWGCPPLPTAATPRPPLGLLPNACPAALQSNLARMRKQERKGGRGSGSHTRTRDGEQGVCKALRHRVWRGKARTLPPPMLVSADQSLLAGCLAERLHLLMGTAIPWPGAGEPMGEPEAAPEPHNPTKLPRGFPQHRPGGSNAGQARTGALAQHLGSVTSIHPAPRIHAPFPTPQMSIPPQLSRHNEGSRVHPAWCWAAWTTTSAPRPVSS